MDKTGVFVGGAIGATIAIVIFGVLFISPNETIKPDIIVNNGHSTSTLGETTPSYAKKLSLIEIFEKSEPGVVRVNVQKGETSETLGSVGSGLFLIKTDTLLQTNMLLITQKKLL